ncbi:hypothetical protein D3C81_1904020 [compost metagenome]
MLSLLRGYMRPQRFQAQNHRSIAVPNRIMHFPGHPVTFLQQGHAFNLRGILLQNGILLVDQRQLLPDRVDRLRSRLQSVSGCVDEQSVR